MALLSAHAVGEGVALVQQVPSLDLASRSIPSASAALAMAASMTNMACGPPKPRKAVKGGRLVRQLGP